MTFTIYFLWDSGCDVKSIPKNYYQSCKSKYIKKWPFSNGDITIKLKGNFAPYPTIGRPQWGCGVGVAKGAPWLQRHGSYLTWEFSKPVSGTLLFSVMVGGKGEYGVVTTDKGNPTIDVSSTGGCVTKVDSHQFGFRQGQLNGGIVTVHVPDGTTKVTVTQQGNLEGYAIELKECFKYFKSGTKCKSTTSKYKT